MDELGGVFCSMCKLSNWNSVGACAICILIAYFEQEGGW